MNFGMLPVSAPALRFDSTTGMITIGGSNTILGSTDNNIVIGSSNLIDASLGALMAGTIAIGNGITMTATATTGSVAANNILIGNGASATGTFTKASLAVGRAAKVAAFNTVVLGDGAAASGSSSVAIGVNAQTSTGGSNTVVGSSTGIVGGSNCTAIGSGNLLSSGYSYSVTLGGGTTTRAVNEICFGNGLVGNAGSYLVQLQNTTTSATPLELFTYPALSGRYVLASNCTIMFTASIVAHRTDVVGDRMSFTITGTMKKEATAATTAIVGTPTTTTTANSGSLPWTVVLSADTTNGSILLTATGEAAKTVKWYARLDLVFVA